MLLQFSCSNYKSIKEPIEFSMLAANDSTASSHSTPYNNMNISRISVIYGANGSGKSNFITAAALAREIIVESIHYQPGQSVVQVPQKLSAKTAPSKFAFQFLVEGIRYAYGFSIVEGHVAEEYLYYFPRNRKAKIFDREEMNLTFGKKYKSSFPLVRDVLKENRLFLSCAANFSKVSEVEKAFLFFKTDFLIYKTAVDEPRMNNWLEQSIDLMDKHPEIKESFTTILSYLGTGIKGVETKVESISPEKIEKTLPKEMHDLVSKILQQHPDSFKSIKAQVIYENFSTDLMTEESTGIQKLFQIICPLMDILSTGKVLLCDELETGLHEKIIMQLIELFCRTHPEKSAQLIFTTHDTNLLDTRIFGREQIWFTQLTQDRSTDLYSLLEIKNVRKKENLAARYIEGKYGAIPILNTELLKTTSLKDVFEK